MAGDKFLAQQRKLSFNNPFIYYMLLGVWEYYHIVLLD